MEGTKLARFRLLSKLGEGGMGVVYRAEEETTGRTVALKVLLPGFASDPSRRRRLFREAKAAAAVRHPNVAGIDEAGEDGGTVFVAMEYVEGRKLRDLLGGRPLPVHEAVSLATQIAEALECAHRVGVIHRDLKPGNMIVQPDGRLKVLDFGIARVLDPQSGSDRLETTRRVLAHKGSVLGTWPYMSPEQARGWAVDARSDLFSLGVVLYEMLTGRNPFRGPSPADTISAILRDRPPAVSDLNPDVAPDLARVLDRLLAKEPADRYPSARALLDDLRMASRAVGTGAVSAMPRSIAVLPFSDLSPRQDQAYFCDGMAEELINALSRVRGLRVAARASAFRFRGKSESVHRIGEELKVEAILTGTVRRSDSHVRVSTELVSAVSGYRLWSDKYDRELEDVFALQDEIASTIVDTLQIRLGVGHEAPMIRRHTKDVAAYHLYLKGRHYWYSRYEGGLQTALAFFEQSIEKDPAYADAYAGLADSYNILGTYALVPPGTAFPKAEAAAERALAIDETLAAAHAARGWTRCHHHWAWEDSEREYQRALELDPNYVQGRIWYALLLTWLRRFDAALATASLALEQDPLSAYAHAARGMVLSCAGRWEEAARECREALVLDPNHVFAVYELGLACLRGSLWPECFEAFRQAIELSRRAPFTVAFLGMANALAGRREEAEAVLKELRDRSQREYVAPLFEAWVLAALGELDQAFERLERAFEERSAFLAVLNVTLPFQPFRSDPRWPGFVRRVGLEP